MAVLYQRNCEWTFSTITLKFLSTHASARSHTKMIWYKMYCFRIPCSVNWSLSTNSWFFLMVTVLQCVLSMTAYWQLKVFWCTVPDILTPTHWNTIYVPSIVAIATKRWRDLSRNNNITKNSVSQDKVWPNSQSSLWHWTFIKAVWPRL